MRNILIFMCIRLFGMNSFKNYSKQFSRFIFLSLDYKIATDHSNVKKSAYEYTYCRLLSLFLECHDVSCQVLVVVCLPLGVSLNGVADSLPVRVVLLVQSWVACSKLVDHPSERHPLAAIGLLMEDLRSAQDGRNAATLDSHLPRKMDVVVSPPSIVDLVVSTNLLPDLLWESRVHAVKVGPWLPPLLHVLQDLSVAESVVSWLEVVGLAQNSWVLLCDRVVLQELVVREALCADEDSLDGDHKGYVVWLGGEELIHVLQKVLVQNDVTVHTNDVVVLGLLNSHVSCAGNRKSVCQLPSLHQSEVKLRSVLSVDGVDVIRGV